MNMIIKSKAVLLLAFLVSTMISPILIDAAEKESTNGSFQPMVVKQFLEEAKKNKNWKRAFVTGQHEQIVFMNVSSKTNPANEIGMEVHAFDQVLLIVDGQAKAILDGKESIVKNGDMIFIPEGTMHNVINLRQKELKLISFYSDTDIPKDAVYPTKADESM